MGVHDGMIDQWGGIYCWIGMGYHDGMIDQWGGIYCWIGMGYQTCTEAAGILPPQDCPGALLASLLGARAIS